MKFFTVVKITSVLSKSWIIFFTQKAWKIVLLLQEIVQSPQERGTVEKGGGYHMVVDEGISEIQKEITSMDK